MKGMLITEKLDEGRMKGNSGEEKYLRPPLTINMMIYN
jgi:hypothetical protein